MKPTKISHLVLMGDSLSDRGTMYHRYLFDLIPMKRLSGLKGKSPIGRFTNGYTWSDDIFAMFANQFGINQLEKKKDAANTPSALVDALVDSLPKDKKPGQRQSFSPDGTDISDGLLDGDLKIKGFIEQSYTLDNNLKFNYEGQNLARSYAEGGLTAYAYAWKLSNSISRFFSRLILSTLSEMRKKLLLDDKMLGITPESKAETLVVEWSGANDLITVNAKPSSKEVDKAIEARIKNVKELMKNGYKHFVLFNLPDLGLTPRFQKKGGKEQANATRCSKEFNKKLLDACAALYLENDKCSVEVFDVETTFTEIYDNPTKYQFDPDKLKIPFNTSKDFEITKADTSPAPGYMFWDDVHPTAHMHEIIANKFYSKYNREYSFTQPVVESEDKRELLIGLSTLLREFRTAYTAKLDKDHNGWFGFFRHSRVDLSRASLDSVLDHAFYKGGNRSLAVIVALGWFDKKGNLLKNIPALKVAKEQVDAAHNDEVAPLVDNGLGK